MSARALLLLVCGVAAACGCVERKMLIRSDPPGAPVWVNETYAGITPVEFPFVFYGVNGIRVGPMRDKQDRLVWEETSVLFAAKQPWYEGFPIDFFFEVLYPFTRTDVQTVPEIKLLPAKPPEEKVDEERMKALHDKATEFRKRALQPVPEEPVTKTEPPVSPRPPG